MSVYPHPRTHIAFVYLAALVTSARTQHTHRSAVSPSRRRIMSKRPSAGSMVNTGLTPSPLKRTRMFFPRERLPRRGDHSTPHDRYRHEQEKNEEDKKERGVGKAVESYSGVFGTFVCNMLVRKIAFFIFVFFGTPLFASQPSHMYAPV